MKSNELKILLVDDEAPIRELNSIILKRTYPGCTVEELKDGKTFSKYEGGAHLYIVDNRMFFMDGCDALDLLRAKQDNTPAVLVTATLADLENKVLPKKTEVLSKPYRTEAFLKTVTEILEKNYGNIEGGQSI